jgi:hypothetical protein
MFMPREDNARKYYNMQVGNKHFKTLTNFKHLQTRSKQIFKKSRNHLKILSTRHVT